MKSEKSNVEFVESNIDKNYKVIDGDMCISTKEFCSRLGIDRKTLNEWASKGCPKSSRGWWPIWKVLAWRGIVNKKSEGQGMKGNDEYSINIQKLRYETELKKHKAEQAEFKNKVEKGEYVKKEDCVRDIQKMLIALRKSMEAFSRKIAVDLSSYVDATTTRKIENDISKSTKEVLRELVVKGVYKFGEDQE